jgi:hypothetical protein
MKANRPTIMKLYSHVNIGLGKILLDFGLNPLLTYLDIDYLSFNLNNFFFKLRQGTFHALLENYKNPCPL